MNNIGTGTVENTIAHEIAHGTFNLRHTFSTENAYVLSENSTDNLMDYREGSELSKFQWDFIHNPESVLFAWLEDEEEGESDIPFKILAMKMTREDSNIPIAYLNPDDQSTYSKDQQYYLDDLTKQNDGIPVPLKKSYTIIIQGAGGKFVKFNKSNNNIKYGPTSTYNFIDGTIYQASADMAVTINALSEGEVFLEVRRFDNVEGTLNEVSDKIKLQIFNLAGPFNAPELSKYTYESSYYIEGKSGWKVDQTQGDKMTLKDSDTEVTDWINSKSADVKWSSAPEGGRRGKIIFKCNDNFTWIINPNIINIKINGSFTETQCSCTKGYKKTVNESGQEIIEVDDSRIVVSACVAPNSGIAWNADITMQSLNNNGYNDIEIGFIQNLEVVRVRGVYKRGDISRTLIPQLNGVSFEGQKWVDFSPTATHINNDIFYFHQGERNSSVLSSNQGSISSNDAPNYNFPIEFKIDNKNYDLDQIDISYNFELYIVSRIKSNEFNAHEKYFIISSATWQWFVNEHYPFSIVPVNGVYIFNKPNSGTAYNSFIDNNQIKLYTKPNVDGQCANSWLPQFILTP
ncbi:MAG: hypothetical protein GX660_06905 [Clostridiaceae bacterium]|nr:hypothetical protein [Clostridiaceae bacterium]